MNKIKYLIIGALAGTFLMCLVLKALIYSVLKTPIGLNVIIPHTKALIKDSIEYQTHPSYKSYYSDNKGESA